MKLPQVVYAGTGSIKNIEIIINKFKNVALFTDKGVIDAGILHKLLEIVNRNNINVTVYDNIPSEPSCDEVQKVINKYKKNPSDLIIALGGGSVMDVAKLAGVLNTDRYSVSDLLNNPHVAYKQTKTLMIPTTAGTGSEATPNSIVSIPELNVKQGIVSDALIADYVILDGDMIRGIPKPIAAATGVDAMAHAVECFTSKKANPFSDMYALEAIKLIFNNIERFYDNTLDEEAGNAMLLASFYAGAAITSSGTTAVHALSYPLGGRYHIPHGISNAILFVPVMKRNEPYCRKEFSIIYDVLITNTDKLSEKEKSEWVLGRIKNIINHLEITTKLRDYDVTEQDLDCLVKDGLQVHRLLSNNKKEITKEDAKAIYSEIL